MFVEMIPTDAVHIVLVYIEEMLEREKRKREREERREKKMEKKIEKREKNVKKVEKRGGEKIEWR